MKALKRLLTTTLKLAVFAGIIAGGYYGYQTYMVEPEEDEFGELPTIEAAIRDITVAVSAKQLSGCPVSHTVQELVEVGQINLGDR